MRAEVHTQSDDAAYEEVEHAADWAFQVRGRDLPELFTNAAQAIRRLEHGERRGDVALSRDVRVEGVDRETLLVNWLNELLYLEQSKREAHQKFEILELDDTHLRARLYGAPEHGVQRRIKAVTFHDLQIRRSDSGWDATVVVDV